MAVDRGFRVLQLLIVVALILMIAAIAIPSLLRSQTASRNSSTLEHTGAGL
jgi:type II secretory pathway pseudopilin PulG